MTAKTKDKVTKKPNMTTRFAKSILDLTNVVAALEHDVKRIKIRLGI